MFAQDTFDEDAPLSPDVFAHRPVDGDVAAHDLDKLVRNGPQRVVPEDFYGAGVSFEGVVKGQFVFGKVEGLAAGVGFPHILCRPDHLFGHLRCFDGPVLVPPQRVTSISRNDRDWALTAGANLA